MNEGGTLSSSRLIKFQPYFIWILILLFFLVQIIRALEPPSLYHPDQIYQSFEIGHYYFYGYGLRAWEWLSPEETYWSEPFIGPARSFITPILFMILYGIGELLNFNYWNQILPFIRITLSLITTLGLVGLMFVIRELIPKFKDSITIIFWLILIFNPIFVVNGSSGFTNMIAIFPLWWGFYFYLKSLKTENMGKKRISGYCSGFLLGISVWLRPDFAILILVLLLTFFPFSNYIRSIKGRLNSKNSTLNINNEKDQIDTTDNSESFNEKIRKDYGINVGVVVFLGGFSSFIFNGLLDLAIWGEFSISIINFLKFNGNPENQGIFGTSSFGWYFIITILDKPTMAFLFIIMLLAVFISLILNILPLTLKKFTDYQFDNTIKKITKKYQKFSRNILRSFFVIGIVLIWWETQPHKESRFLFAWESFFLFLSAFSVVFLILILIDVTLYGVNFLKKDFLTNKRFLKIKPIIIVLIVVFMMVPYYAGVLEEAGTIPWRNFDDVLEAQVYVGQQNDLSGLIVIGSTWYDGGHTFLHKNVSIMRIDTPGENDSLNYFIKTQTEYNYLITPHYKYYEFEFLKFNLQEYNWTLNITILDRTDVWVR